MTATTGYSTRELQAAAAALASGQFATDGRQRRPTHPGSSTWQPEGPLVRVMAANAGAGASTIALALADVAAQRVPVWLVDAAAPTWSGLVGASGTELGGADRWRRGRRNDRLVIDRLDEHARTPADVPVPREAEPAALTVLDLGWTSRELDAHPNGWLNTTESAADVVVTRASASAFGQAEVLLAHADLEACVLVVIGANRWSGSEFASAGHRMRQLRESGAIAFVPLLGARALTGLGPEPLPRPLTLSAQRVLDRITAITGPLQAARTTHFKENS
jgi:hypothetical protein